MNTGIFLICSLIGCRNVLGAGVYISGRSNSILLPEELNLQEKVQKKIAPMHECDNPLFLSLLA
jgi:hypothetical protein